MRKQSKKTIKSLQMSPRMASLRQAKVLVFHFLTFLHWWASQVISLRQAIMYIYNKKGLKSLKQIQCKFKINSCWLHSVLSTEPYWVGNCRNPRMSNMFLFFFFK